MSLDVLDDRLQEEVLLEAFFVFGIAVSSSVFVGCLSGRDTQDDSAYDRKTLFYVDSILEID
jgi:hypothetical protein